MIIIRGNHDCPKRFIGKWIEEKILFAEDYHILEFNDKKIQLVGGAISIDRSERVVNRSWWVNEEVKFIPERIEKVDILITHATPTSAGFQKANCNDMVRHITESRNYKEGICLVNLKTNKRLFNRFV